MSILSGGGSASAPKAEDKLGEDSASQSAENRQDVLAAAQPGSATATGQARAQLTGEEDERLKDHKDRGSTVEIVGGAPTGDLLKPRKPVGAQTEPAVLTFNGTVEAGMLPSPYGPVPVSSQASSVKDAERKLDEHRANLDDGRRSAFDELSEQEVLYMDSASLRAIAQNRDYKNFPHVGTRQTRQIFLQRQKEDPSFKKQDELEPS